jgi:hypothetical protein
MTNRDDWLQALAAAGVEAMQAQLAAEACALLGVRYRHQGRIPARGLDCLGLGYIALKAIGYVPRDPDIFSRRDYPAEADDDDLAQSLQSEAGEVSGPLQLGDVLLFRWPTQEHAGHMGVISRLTPDGPVFAHACISHRRVTEQPLKDEWEKRLVAAYRLRDFLDLQSLA